MKTWMIVLALAPCLPACAGQNEDTDYELHRILAQQTQNACIARHEDAKLSCQLLLQGESDPQAFNDMMLQCLSDKGFPHGLDDCPLPPA